MDKIEAEVILKNEIEKVQKIIEEYKEMTQPIGPDNAIGRISRIDAIQNKSVADGGLRNMVDKLDKLNYLLSKVNDDDFGICLKCKESIPIGRFLARPESLHCVRCAR